MNYINNGITIINKKGIEEQIGIPYNINNILVNKNDVLNIVNSNIYKEHTISSISNIVYFQQAFTHISYCYKPYLTPTVIETVKQELLDYNVNIDKLVELQTHDYERLEFIGDKVLKTIIATYLFMRYPNKKEGFYSIIQSRLEDKKNFAYLCQKIKLNNFILISHQIENLRTSDRISEDVFESFVGALYLTTDYTTVMYFVFYLIENYIDISDKIYHNENYKQQLLEYYHSVVKLNPVYEKISENGPSNKCTYIVGIVRYRDIPGNNKYFAWGKGNNIKSAEQRAAKMALILLNQLNEDKYTSTDLYYGD